MKLLAIVFLSLSVTFVCSAGKKRQKAPPTMMNEHDFAGLPPGATKAQCAAKGFICKDVHIGDYITLVECRKPMEFAGRTVEAYAQMNSAGSKAESVGFDVFFPGDQITPAQDQFYKFEKEVEAMLATQPSVITTPDTYLALTNFNFPKTVVSCYLYSDDRTKPPRLRCGAEVRVRK